MKATLYTVEVPVFPDETTCDLIDPSSGNSYGAWIPFKDGNGNPWAEQAGPTCDDAGPFGHCPNTIPRNGYQPTYESLCIRQGGEWAEDNTDAQAAGGGLATQCTAVYCPRGVTSQDMDRCFDGDKQDCVVCDYDYDIAGEINDCARRRMAFMGGEYKDHVAYLQNLESHLTWQLPAPETPGVKAVFPEDEVVMA